MHVKENGGRLFIRSMSGQTMVAFSGIQDKETNK